MPLRARGALLFQDALKAGATSIDHVVDAIPSPPCDDSPESAGGLRFTQSVCLHGTADVQELTNFFERKVSSYQVAVQGEVAFDQARTACATS
jgi:hypothetical protein